MVDDDVGAMSVDIVAIFPPPLLLLLPPLLDFMRGGSKLCCDCLPCVVVAVVVADADADAAGVAVLISRFVATVDAFLNVELLAAAGVGRFVLEQNPRLPSHVLCCCCCCC